MISITARDRALLNLIASKEASKGKDPYTSLWPGTTEPSLIQMTLSEVQIFQRNRVKQGFKSSACGRYQFIKNTLGDCIKLLGVDPLTIRFTPDVQDALMIARLSKTRKYLKWISGDITTDQFMLELAMEFASFPVPYKVKGAHRSVEKGETYYAGDSLNKAHHDPDTLFIILEDIRINGGANIVKEIDATANQAKPAIGKSEKTQQISELAGIGVGAVVGGNAGDRRLPSPNLVTTYDIYTYEKPKAFTTRYDVRYGTNVVDTTIYGLDTIKEKPQISSTVGVIQSTLPNIGSIPINGKIETPNSTIKSIIEDVDSIFGNISNIVDDLIDQADDFLGDGFDFIGDFIDQAESLIDDTIGIVDDIANSANEFINQATSGFVDMFEEIVDTVESGIEYVEDSFDIVTDTVAEVTNPITSNLTNFI